jgi:hypothetical protein
MSLSDIASAPHPAETDGKDGEDEPSHHVWKFSYEPTNHASNLGIAPSLSLLFMNCSLADEKAADSAPVLASLSPVAF